MGGGRGIVYMVVQSMDSTFLNGVALVTLGRSVTSTTYDRGMFLTPFMFDKFEINLSRYVVQFEWPLGSGNSMIASSSPSASFRF